MDTIFQVNVGELLYNAAAIMRSATLSVKRPNLVKKAGVPYAKLHMAPPPYFNNYRILSCV